MPEKAIARGRMPENAVRVTLPATEVCMHLKIACRQVWAAKVSEHTAQIYDEHGYPYSAPVLLCEAGLDRDGQPKPLHEPTGLAVRLPDPDDPQARIRVVIPDPSSGPLTIEAVDEQPTIKLTLQQIIGQLNPPRRQPAARPQAVGARTSATPRSRRSARRPAAAALNVAQRDC